MRRILLILRKLYYLRSYSKFKRIGENVIFSKKGLFIRPSEIEFGNNIFINSGFHISARSLSIGDNVMIGPNLVIECDDHVYDKIGSSMFETKDERKGTYVKIENDIWIGANVTILKDVTIEEGTVVGAGSVVVKSLPPYSVCVGNPCKPIRPRFDVDNLEKHLSLIRSNKNLQDILIKWKGFNLIL